MANAWWAENASLHLNHHHHLYLIVQKADHATTTNSCGNNEHETSNKNNNDSNNNQINSSNDTTCNCKSRGRPAGSKISRSPRLSSPARAPTRSSPTCSRSPAASTPSPGGGSGVVLKVSLRQPGAPPGAVVSLHGRFEILSMSGVFLPVAESEGASGMTSTSPTGRGRWWGERGRGAHGGRGAGGGVMVIATMFANATYKRLPLEDEQARPPSDSNMGLELSSGNGNTEIEI